jgi:branched-chain amino acid transport system substrate-binding protein
MGYNSSRRDDRRDLMMRLLWVLTAFLLAFASCSQQNGNVPGITEDTIKVGMITDLTGPIAFGGQEISAGARLYLQHVNEQGGVHGRRIDLIVEDDGYQPSRTVVAARKLLDRDQVLCFFGNMGTATTLAIESILESEGVPLFAPATWSSVVYTPPRRYIFTTDPSYRMQSWMMLSIIRQETQGRHPRIGVIYQDDDFGHDGINGLREAAAYYGMNIVAEEEYKRGAVDFSTQVLNLKRANATHVILWTVLRETAAVLKEARLLDWHPVFFGNTTFADDKLVELAGEAAENLRALSNLNLSSDTDHMKLYLELIDRYDPGRTPQYYHAAGYTFTQFLVEVLQRAGRDLNREKLVTVAENFRGWDDNLAHMPFTYGPDLRGGSIGQVYLARVDVGQKRFVYDKEPIRFEMPADFEAAGGS